MKNHGSELVKSCRKLESGLRLGVEGIHACQLGPFASPIYWSAEEAAKLKITKEMIVEKRKWLFQLLNDDHSDIACKQCHMVKSKRYEEVTFSRLGHIDLAATTTCNLRCSFCGYTVYNSFSESRYDALAILREFTAEDVEWDSAVDFNGGEPTLLRNLDDYINYFLSRRVRVYLYTNGVLFRQSIYDGLVKGTIRWVCSSLDAGTPSTFLRLKKRDHFLQVLENLTRYAHAGSQGGGKLAVKYIFCQGNFGDDDVGGFAYAMLAIRPQQIWLTFDFEPLGNLPRDSQDFGGYDYSSHIAAYVKLYGLLKKHGLQAGHFTENHLAAVCQQGKTLMEQVMLGIERLERHTGKKAEELSLRNFRLEEESLPIESASFATSPLRVKNHKEEAEPWSLLGKRVALVPACSLSTALLGDPEVRGARIIGFFDRDPVLHGKEIDGIPIHGYSSIPELHPEVILVAAPQEHRGDILRAISKYATKGEQVAVLDRC